MQQMHQLRIFVYLLKLSISYDIQKGGGIRLSPVIKTVHSVSTVSSIQNTGSTETLLLIKLQLHFEGFSFNLVPRVHSYPPSLASQGGQERTLGTRLIQFIPIRGFPECSYKRIAFSVIPPYLMYGNPDIRILKMFACGFWNQGDVCLRSPEFQALEPGIQLKKSGIQLKSAIRNPSSTDNIQYPVSGIRNPCRGIQRFQECLGLLYMGRQQSKMINILIYSRLIRIIPFRCYG